MKKQMLFILLLSTTTFGQYKSFFGYSAGLSFSFGTKVNRIGVQVAAYYNYAIGQVNGQFNLYYDFQSMGLKKKTPEIQLGLGLDVGFGREDSVRNQYVGLTENNMEHVYSVGYSYIRYWDKIGTSQSSGIFSFNFTDFKIAFENDLFAGGQGWRDRFRTGGMLFAYYYQDFKFGIANTLWTADYSEGKSIDDPDYPARYGYRSDDNVSPFNASLGLLCLRAEYLVPYLTQKPRVEIGIDSEHIRNFFQNKLLHDLKFLPDKMIKHKPYHIPMLDRKDGQYLYRNDEKVKKSSFYFNAGLNNMPFY